MWFFLKYSHQKDPCSLQSSPKVLLNLLHKKHTGKNINYSTIINKIPTFDDFFNFCIYFFTFGNCKTRIYDKEMLEISRHENLKNYITLQVLNILLNFSIWLLGKTETNDYKRWKGQRTCICQADTKSCTQLHPAF